MAGISSQSFPSPTPPIEGDGGTQAGAGVSNFTDIVAAQIQATILAAILSGDSGLVAAISAVVTAADHLAPIARTGATAIAGSGTALVAIPAGSKSYSIGSADLTRALPLTGYAAASNSPRTKTGPISTLNDSGPIPATLDDGATAPTHLYVAETGAVGGTFWIDWYK